MDESCEEQPQLRQQQTEMKECMHKTKTIQFLGRTTPIILQNDNGPCPLLAICNVLLLRNNLNLSPDTGEVSQEKLLSLVAERLIDSNSDINNKDAGYVENQQQNIADAIDLLPCLATGIDVNIKFRRIDEFEFTRECAIFDLLDIPLYHGWIVDPQDYDTANAIGSKSYNAITGELVALEITGGEHKSSPEEDCVDFAAATSATLGVPSPCLSKARSFDDSPRSVSDQQKLRKGDLEEEEELLRALKLSKTEWPSSLGYSLVANVNGATMSVNSDESTCSNVVVPSDSVHTLEAHNGVENQSFHQPEPSISDNGIILSNDDNNKNMVSFGSIAGEEKSSSLKADGGMKLDQPSKKESVENNLSNDLVLKNSVETLVQVEETISFSPGKDTATALETRVDISQGGKEVENKPTSIDVHEPADNLSRCSPTEVLCLSVPNGDSDSSSGRIQLTDVPETFTSSVDGSEPIYEGEECILDSGTAVYDDQEPVYEGEVILAEQAEADNSTSDTCNVRSKYEITQHQGELIKSFLKNNASQLTFYGLFCLQDGLKERELCVFFRNNHFSSMFKYDGELYLLATDQGYLNQPDLVWEKLNEVNGDTLFMTSNFKEFKVESHGNESWDEHGAMTSTADYLAHYDTTAHGGSDMHSDLQLALALQQEFEQQPQRPDLQQQQPPVTGSSKLITGPQDFLMGFSKTEINLRRLLAAAPQQHNQAKLIHYVATLREQLEQLAEERTPEGLPRISKAQLNDYSEKIEAIASKLAAPLPPIRVSEDTLKSNSFNASTSKTDGEIHTPTSPGLRRRFVPSSNIEDRTRGTFEADTSEPVKLDAQAQLHIEKHRKLQENLTDEMVGLARQLKESSLLISQSVQNTEKVLDSTEKAIEQSLASTGHANVRAMKIYSESSKTTCFTWLLMFAMTCIFIMVVLLIRVT